VSNLQSEGQSKGKLEACAPPFKTLFLKPKNLAAFAVIGVSK
jgi:hypothetical protein